MGLKGQARASAGTSTGPDPALSSIPSSASGRIRRRRESPSEFAGARNACGLPSGQKPCIACARRWCRGRSAPRTRRSGRCHPPLEYGHWRRRGQGRIWASAAPEPDGSALATIEDAWSHHSLRPQRTETRWSETNHMRVERRRLMAERERGILSLLDLEAAGLERVKAAIEAGNHGEAETANLAWCPCRGSGLRWRSPRGETTPSAPTTSPCGPTCMRFPLTVQGGARVPGAEPES